MNLGPSDPRTKACGSSKPLEFVAYQICELGFPLFRSISRCRMLHTLSRPRTTLKGLKYSCVPNGAARRAMNWRSLGIFTFTVDILVIVDVLQIKSISKGFATPFTVVRMLRQAFGSF